MRLAYLPLFVRDFLTDPNVLAMRWIDQAIYLRMLMASWEAGPLPDDAEIILRLIGGQALPSEIPALVLSASQRFDPTDLFDAHAAIRAVLGVAWLLGPSGWTNPRLERERTRSLAIKDALSENGRRGAQARWDGPAMARPSQGDGKGLLSQAQAQAQRKNQKKKNPPNPPSGGASSGSASPKKAKPRKAEWSGIIPPSLASSPAFARAWAAWLEYRRSDLRKPVTPLAGSQALQELERWGPVRAVAAIEHTIARGWQGLREPEQPRNGHHQNGHHHHQTDRERAAFERDMKELGLA